ncbi:MAG: hypothetical protein HOG45_03195 [Deltaproteobacteria bacterium]|nr:hypothetical protein [Deltaproteobacteria bacterium]
MHESVGLSLFRKICQFPLSLTAGVKGNSWVRSPAWDVFWLHSGLWLTLLMLMTSDLHVQEMFYAAGVFLFWISHRFSSFYLAWRTQAYHPLLKNQQVRFVFIPLLLVSFVFAVLFIPESVLPVPVSVRILGMILLDFAWGMHHFAAQHYGLLRLYHHRWNSKSAPLFNKRDRWYCWGVGGGLVLIAELLHGTSFLQEKNFLPLLTGDWVFEGIPLLLRLGTLLVAGITIFMIRNAFLHDSGLPRILYILGIGVMVMGAYQLNPFQFFMLWTLQHWMVALGLTVHMAGNDTTLKTNPEIGFTGDSSVDIFWKPWKVLFLLCTFSVLMTPFLEIEAVSAGGRYSEQFLPSFMEWLQNSSWERFLVGIGLASGFMHYFMDRAVYRFSDPETRKSAQKLLFV